MKRKLMSIFITAVMLNSLFVKFTISANTKKAPIALGEYVQMGTYDINNDGIDEPVLWRCVAFEKVTGTDTAGNPITDSSQAVTEYQEGYLPLMLADSSICKKAFDMPGNNAAGSHGRSEKRLSHGSNYWADSNIRDWLNSSSDNVVYACGNKPSYSDEAGFLSNFTAEEKAVMNTVTQKSILPKCDKDITGVSGTKSHTYNNSVANAVQNYNEAYSEQTTDTMFLLDVQQVKNTYDNLEDYYEPYFDTLYYWLRTPNADTDYLTRIAFRAGEVNGYTVQSSNVGIRPSFYLNPSAVLYGEGARYYPYMAVPYITPTANPTISPNIAPPASPAASPSISPTSIPTALPSSMPAVYPTVSPIMTPTSIPAALPSSMPAVYPTVSPSITTTSIPTALPSSMPAVHPTASPCITPTSNPLAIPSQSPEATSKPSENAKCIKITAEYSENGALISIAAETVNVLEILPEQNIKTRKVFYWESFESMKPIYHPNIILTR